MVICVLMVALVPMCILGIVLNDPTEPPLRLLFVNCLNSQDGVRTAAGAQAAAQELGLDLRVMNIAADFQPTSRAAALSSLNAASFNGIAVCPPLDEHQIDVINDIAGRTKLVTVGGDSEMSNRLSTVGFCPKQSGRHVTSFVYETCAKGGNALLLTTRSAVPGQNAISEGRCVGFREGWGEFVVLASSNRFAFRKYVVDKTNPEHIETDVAGHLADPQLSLIIAFDAQSAETALAELVRRPRTKHIPFIAFDTTPAILDAIENGYVDSAIIEDPYRAGYEAMKCLVNLCRRDSMTLPMPGRGSYYLFGQVVTKANLRSFR